MKKVLMHVYVPGSVTEKWAAFLGIMFWVGRVAQSV
jgi:hypothetical protein